VANKLFNDAGNEWLTNFSYLILVRCRNKLMAGNKIIPYHMMK
jgi:hypothetical protein